MNETQQAILDLSTVGDLANILVRQLSEGEQPNQLLLNTLRELAENVQRQFGDGNALSTPIFQAQYESKSNL